MTHHDVQPHHRLSDFGQCPSPAIRLNLNPIFSTMAASENGSSGLHGNVTHPSGIALLIIDFINDLEFPDNEHLVRHSGKLADSILRHKERCNSLGIPAIIFAE